MEGANNVRRVRTSIKTASTFKKKAYKYVLPSLAVS
jgi:hypothetical protein